MPMGSGAVTGATLPLDRELVSRAWDSRAQRPYSMDATAIAILPGTSQYAFSAGRHLSRWAEEFILFATQEYGFITLPGSF